MLIYYLSAELNGRISLWVIKTYPYSPISPELDDRQNRHNVSLKKINPIGCFFRNDAAFDWLYPEHLQLMSQKQWTPIAIAKKASEYLAIKGAKILDVGSGIGKFCLTAAHLHPETHYFGVEQRHELVHYAKTAKAYLNLDNTSFLHANITQINFNEFDHFYFFNSFYENLDPQNAIDDTIETSYCLYEYYTKYLYTALKGKPAGTRVVTYQSFGEVIPNDYQLVDLAFNTLLRLWIKK